MREVAQGAVGLGEGVAPPAATGMMAKWVPASERARAVAALRALGVEL